MEKGIIIITVLTMLSVMLLEAMNRLKITPSTSKGLVFLKSILLSFVRIEFFYSRDGIRYRHMDKKRIILLAVVDKIFSDFIRRFQISLILFLGLLVFFS